MQFGTQKASADHKQGSGKNAKGAPKITVPEAPYPIYDDFKEFVNAAGSPEAALGFVNAAVKTAAGARVREFVGDSPETTPESEIIIKAIEAGKAFIPVSPPNVLTQEGSNDPVSFTLILPRPIWRASFTVPPLIASTEESGITFPMWSAYALDAENKVIDSTGREPSGSYIHQFAETHSLQASVPHEHCIESIRFDSDNKHHAAFSGILIDDLALWNARPERCQ